MATANATTDAYGYRLNQGLSLHSSVRPDLSVYIQKSKYNLIKGKPIKKGNLGDLTENKFSALANYLERKGVALSEPVEFRSFATFKEIRCSKGLFVESGGRIYTGKQLDRL